MKSTMNHLPLRVSQLLAHGAATHCAARLITADGPGVRSATYAQLDERARRLSRALEILGVEPGDSVATFMWNTQEHVEAYFAVPCMGAVLHPLNIRLSPEQVAYTISHAGDEVVLVDASLLEVFRSVLPLVDGLRHVVVRGAFDPALLDGVGPRVHDYETVVSSASPVVDWPVVDEDAAAVICHTSGTTGPPKGVVYSHRSIYLHSLAISLPNAFHLSWNDAVLVVVPQFHALAWGLPYAALLTGADLVLPDADLGPEALTALIVAAGATRAAAVPTVWLGILDHLDAHPEVALPTLHEGIVGGAPCPAALLEGFERRHGIALVHAWGMTEMSPTGTVSRPPRGVDPDHPDARRLAQGRFLPPVEARLVDDAGGVVPHDGRGAGHLEVRGPYVTGAYHQDPAAGAFHDGWLVTGDVGTIDAEGYFSLTDRSKDVIKSGGEWISSVDLENHLMSHPAVAEAAVVGVPDPKWDERPLAAVVLRPGTEATPDALRTHLADRFAKWQLPDRWAFVPEIPRTSVGKFDKVAIRRAWEAGTLTPAPPAGSA